MPEGGSLGISVTNVRIEEQDVSLTGRAAGAYVRFAVSDTGSGISLETREKYSTLFSLPKNSVAEQV
jgi:signal transduction histidine kinase